MATPAKASGVQMSLFDQLMLKYNVTLGLYMLEPWERMIFNSVLVGTFSLWSFAMVHYLPGWLQMALDSVSDALN